MDILISVYGTNNKEEIEELSTSLEDNDNLTKLITYAPYIYSSVDKKEAKRRALMVGLDKTSFPKPITKEAFIATMTKSYVTKNAKSINAKDYIRERSLIGMYKTKKSREILSLFKAKFEELSVGIDDLTIVQVKKRVEGFLKYVYPFIITYNTVRSISNKNVEVRNLIKAIPNPNQTFKNMLLDNLVIGNSSLDTSLDTAIMKNRGEGIKEKIEEDLFHTDAINVIEEIEKVEKVIKNITVKELNDYHHLNVLEIYIIALATGRRFTEIVKTATINKEGCWEGILKKSNNDKATYKAYLFKFTKEEINKKLQNLRTRLRVLSKGSTSFDEMTEKEISNTYNGRYNKILRTYTDKINSYHDVRHHWTINGVKQFKETGESEKDTRQKILSHAIAPDASETYSRILKK